MRLSKELISGLQLITSTKKNADATLAEDADKFISTYRQYFPAQEEAFMYDIMDGSSYTVACGGLRETTIVKTRK